MGEKEGRDDSKDKQQKTVIFKIFKLSLFGNKVLLK